MSKKRNLTNLNKLFFKTLFQFIYFSHALLFMYLLIVILISPFLFLSSTQTFISFDQTRDVELFENPNFKYLNVTDIKLAKENIVQFYRGSAFLNQTYFSPVEIEHYQDVKELYYFNIILCIFVSIYLFGLALYLIVLRKYFSPIRNILKYCVYILIGIIPLFVFFEYFWVHIFHPILFPQGGFAILKPQYSSYYLYSHQFFLTIGGIIYITLFLILFSLKILINKLLKYIEEKD